MPQSDEPRALPPEDEGAPQSIAQRPPSACGRPRSAPSAYGMGRPQPRIASAANNTAATVEPASRRGCAKATTPGAEDAMTARRIRAPRPNHQVRESSAGPYDGRRSRPGSEPRLPSPSTQGRQGRSCGLRITSWHASWEGRTTTTSSSATSPFSSLMLPGHGWNICLLRRSPTGTTWSRPWELVGSPELPPAARGIPARVHPAVFQAAHRVAQHHRLGRHRGIPRWHHLPRPGEQSGTQDSHQGE
jgi:hypothetical protein